MSRLIKFSRIVAPVFSLSLLAGYVVYSHQSANIAKDSADRSDTSNENFQHLLHDDDPLAAALNPNALRHQLRPSMGDSLTEEAFPRRKYTKPDNTQSKTLAPIGPLFQTDQPMMMGGTKSGVVRIVFPLRLSQAFQSVPLPDERTWTLAEQPNPLRKELMDQLADPVVIRTILADDGTAAAKSGRLSMPDELWKEGRHDELHSRPDVSLTDYSESWISTFLSLIGEDQPLLMASSKSGALRFVFPSRRPPSFPLPIVLGQTGADPDVVKTILSDDGTAAAKSGRLVTPEKLWDKFLWQSTMMSSSKSGRVFKPPLFYLTRPLLETDTPLKP
jgi:hypothetical protein